MRIIELTRGRVTVVDDEDYDYLSRWKWHVGVTRGGMFHARRNSTVSDGPGERPSQRVFAMHRVIMNAPQGMEVDHRDHDMLNNMRVNLRLASPQQNAANTRSRVGSTSRYKGVYFSRATGKWAAQICVDAHNQYLGLFELEEEAAHAYDVAAARHFGDFAFLNLESAK